MHVITSLSARMYNCLRIRDLGRQIINSVLCLACTKLHQKDKGKASAGQTNTFSGVPKNPKSHLDDNS